MRRASTGILLRGLFVLCTSYFVLPSPLSGQSIAVDSTRGRVGESIRVPFRIEGGGSGVHGVLTVSGTMQLSNPTVFYPQRFIAPDGDSILGSTLHAIKDSIYQISVTIRRDSIDRGRGDTLFHLGGEALAGSDSLCRLIFRDTRLNEIPVTTGPGAVITRSIGPPLPYVRFAILEQNYPNPVPRGGTTTWAYRIDKRSDVRFTFYNLLGEELFVFQLGDQDIGPHTFTLTPQLDMPSGVYLIRLTTNSGSVDKVMHILR